ncbi:hypothetical protein ACA910_017414 [Epithemia clementina (nom. ined.)]
MTKSNSNNARYQGVRTTSDDDEEQVQQQQQQQSQSSFAYHAADTIPLPLLKKGEQPDLATTSSTPNNNNPNVVLVPNTQNENDGHHPLVVKPMDHAPQRPGLSRQSGQRPLWLFRSISYYFSRDVLFPFRTRESLDELRRQVVAEFLGTFILLFLGLGSVMSANITGSLEGLFQVAAVWCFAVTTAIATVGPISGAHINPAISLAFVVLRPGPQFNWPKFFPYVIAQILGAALGAWVNFFMYGTEIADFERQHGIVRNSTNALATASCFGDYYQLPVTLTRAFFTEVIGTAFLAGVVFALTHPDNDTTKRNVYVAPFIGICVGALVCCLAPLTGAAMNPARDLGPRIVAYLAGWHALAFRQVWLYLIAPCLGAPLGAFIADQVLFGGYDDPTTSATGPTTTSEHYHHHQQQQQQQQQNQQQQQQQTMNEDTTIPHPE